MLAAFCFILSLPCPIVKSSIAPLLDFLGTGNNMSTGMVVSRKIGTHMHILINEYCYIIT